MVQANAEQQSTLRKIDPVWSRVREEAEEIVRREPELATLIYSSVLHHANLESAVVFQIPSLGTDVETARQQFSQSLQQVLGAFRESRLVGQPPHPFPLPLRGGEGGTIRHVIVNHAPCLASH